MQTNKPKEDNIIIIKNDNWACQNIFSLFLDSIQRTAPWQTCFFWPKNNMYLNGNVQRSQEGLSQKKWHEATRKFDIARQY